MADTVYPMYIFYLSIIFTQENTMANNMGILAMAQPF